MIGPKRKLHRLPPACLGDLPNCLLVEIIVRLPLITVHRSKLVCKRWHSVISEPYFVDRFSQNEKLSTQFFGYYNYSKEIYMYNCDSYSYHMNKELSFDFIKSDIRVEASSDDLLLCTARPLTKPDRYLVCNPVTRKQVLLPPFPRLAIPNQWAYKRCIGFTSKKSGEFAVIRINYYAAEFSKSSIWVLSSNTLEWVEKPFPPTPKVEEPWLSTRYAGVPYKGQFFWYEVFTKEIIYIDPFNVGTENWWHFIDPPKGFFPFKNRNYRCSEYLGLCRKTLRFCQISREIGNDDIILRVWDLKGEVEWILYHVSLQNLVMEYGFGQPIYVKDCHPNDPDIIYLTSYFDRNDYMTSLSYNISTYEMKKVHPIPPYESCSFHSVVPYTVQWRPTPLPSLEE